MLKQIVTFSYATFPFSATFYSFAALLASLLEMMLDSSLSDLRVAQGVALPFCPSLVRLLRLLQDFLFAEGTDNHSLWSEKVSNKNTTKVHKWSGCLHLQRVGHKKQTFSLCNLRTSFSTKTEAGVLLLFITQLHTSPRQATHLFSINTYKLNLKDCTVTHAVSLDCLLFIFKRCLTELVTLVKCCYQFMLRQCSL